MDWNNKTWKIEDVIYQPKRKVHNRGSRFHPHVIGEFYSHKMDHSVEYQSMTEFKFFSFLELDNSILRYYVSVLHNSKIDVKTTGSNKDQAYMVAPF